MSDNYNWRARRRTPPASNSDLGWDETFEYRKKQLAKKWDSYTYEQRMTLLERLMYYSAITEVQDLSDE